jgi:hypothetical protein
MLVTFQSRGRVWQVIFALASGTANPAAAAFEYARRNNAAIVF